MDSVEVFLWAYLLGMVVGCFAEGLWGKRLAKAGLLSPFAVAGLWPFGLFLAVAATPFVSAFALGRWISSRAAHQGASEP